MPDITKRLAKAQKYMEKGKHDDALEEYKLAFREDPANDGLVEMIADLYLRQNEGQKALDCYGYLFDKRVEQNDGPGVVLMYRKMARLGPQEPVRILTCARFQEKQRPEEARELYRTCAQKFLERGDQNQALEALRRLAALEPSNPSAHIRFGELAESLGQKREAGQAFVQASQLLEARDSDGRFRDQSLSLLERAHSLVPDEPQIVIAVATAFLGSHVPARAVQVLEALPAAAGPERNRLLAEAYLAAGKISDAEPLLCELGPQWPDAHALLLQVAESYLAAGNAGATVRLLHRLKPAPGSGRKDEVFLGWVEGLQQKNPDNLELVEFLTSLYQELDRGAQFTETLSYLFDLSLKTGDYLRATSALERLVEARSSPEQNQARLQRLQGHVDEHTYKALASRMSPRPSAGPPPPESWMDAFGIGPEAGASAAASARSPEGTAPAGSLDEMMLQAELFLQFGQMDEAIQYLQQIGQVFPGEESHNEKLSSLRIKAGLAAPPPAAPAAAASKPGPVAASREAAAADSAVYMGRISEIVRNIYRQGNVQGVLSTGVAEIGKTWEVSRCLVGLGAPGRPPTAIQEYLAGGVAPSDGVSAARLVASLLELTVAGEPLAVEDVTVSNQLSGITPVLQALGIRSLLALPLVESEKPSGVVVLEQCDQPRSWYPQQVVALKAIADQMAMATAHVRLRSLMKAVGDESSGLLNRNSYPDCLLAEVARAQKQNTPLSVALLQFGKGAQTIRELGEECVREYMQEVAKTLVGHLRQNDFAIRYDATTLAIVLHDTTGKNGVAFVDRARKILASVRIGQRPGLPITAGVAEAVVRGGIEPADSVTELVNRVEPALEGAHAEGLSSKLAPPPTFPPT